MYLLNTFLDEYRLPYMEKQQICKESVFIKNTEELHEVLNQYFQALENDQKNMSIWQPWIRDSM